MGPTWEEAIEHQTPDAQIVLASLEEPRDFAVLFDRHHLSIYRFLVRRIGPEPARDLASETFVVAFTRRGTYDLTQSSARPWLFGIAVNLLRNHSRSERRLLKAYAETGTDPIRQDPMSDVDTRLDAQARGPEMAQALDSLRPDDRDVLLLHAWADMTYEQIASALSIPIGTVRSRLARARQVLRELLGIEGQVGVEDEDERRPRRPQ
jgi:RNA polymerase sigma-70 factor (ECF subfamily)